ncbi:YceG family protein [Sporosarcina sp. FSL K6-1522]|uniref:YceG family protein n=1 Tax=Sporosarcina sp. FSL K6-1522 TaxID=2921554 RepID=UPI00315AD415
MSYIQIEPILDTRTTDWLARFLASSRERPSYYIDDSTFRFNRIGLRVLGVPLVEDEYYNSLFDMQEKSFIHVLSEELDKTIANEDFQAVQEILLLHQKEPKGLSINRLIAFMYGKNLIPKHNDIAINRHVQLSTIKIVTHFQQQQNRGLQSPEFRRFLIDIVKWLKNHWEKWSESLIVGDDFPKVVWYGELSSSQKYFLLLLMEFGCDILIFHPAAQDLFAEVDPKNERSIMYEYADSGELQPFPTQLRDRETTVAYRATKQLEKMMNDHQSGVYKPWQFRDYIPNAITLRMTYDDVFIYAKEKAMIRPDFKIEENRVSIPVIFAKIQGVSSDRADYWERMHTLTNDVHALGIQQFPFAKTTKANYHFHYQHSLDREGVLSPEKMVKSNWWRYGQLSLGLQTAIAHTIKACCEQPKLQKLKHESDYDVQLFIFKQASLLADEVLQLLQGFDYSQEVPRLVLYNMESNGEPSREDAATLLFLNQFGVDIIFYNPAGHTDIEEYIDLVHYDIHWLEDMVFGQAYQEYQVKEESRFKRFIKNIF